MTAVPGVRVWLVRHGEPTERVGVDPGLGDAGHAQAAALVDVLAPAALVTSPLRRARETAAPLEAAWGTVARVDPAFRELPSASSDPVARRAWLQVALDGTFADLGDEQRAWRDAILAALRALTTDTVVTTHAVVINAITGHCEAHDRVLAWIPAHTSVTELLVGGDGSIALVARGAGREGGVVV